MNRCHACSSSKNLVKVEEFYLCEHCVPIFSFTCPICNETKVKYRASQDEYTNKLICDKCSGHLNICKLCHKTLTKDNFCYNCTVANQINSYGYKPDPIFYRSDKEDKLFAGIELEINFNEKPDFKKFLLDSKNKFGEFVYLKHDGSLQGTGVEIVSHPANIKYHLSHFWKDIFEYLKNTNTDGCGFHIHLNKDYFSEKKSYILDYIVNNCNKVICDIGSRALKNYCRRIKKNHYGLHSYSEHTYACNMTNRYTIELRFCKSTNRYDTFVRKLKMISALIAFVDMLESENINVKTIDIANEFDKFKGDYLSAF